MEISNFVQQVQELLVRDSGPEAADYFDIGSVSEISAADLESNNAVLPRYDPLAEVFCLLLPEIKNGNLDKIKLAINEIFKHYLRQLAKTSSGEELTRQYLCRLRLIFQVCLREDFLYALELWDYLSVCFDNVGGYIYTRGLIGPCRVFLDQSAAMGKLAAQRGLHTSSLQHFLRTLEVAARENGDEELAQQTRNHRFNLEG